MANPKITKVEILTLDYDLSDLELQPPLLVPVYKPGAKLKRKVGGIRLHTDAGVTGEFVGGNILEFAAVPGLAHHLVGRDAFDREGFYAAARHSALLGAHGLGVGVADIAMWDLAGRLLGVPIYRLLGGAPRRLRCYASTHVADRHPGGLDSPEAFADLAERCLKAGYSAFKIHPWQDSTIDEMVAAVTAVGERVGGRMELMIDPFNSIKRWGDAVRLGQACDAQSFRWWEDPFRDGGISISAHTKLKEHVKTPLLQAEHIRGLEPHVDLMRFGGTDLVRGDAYYDGITGVLKIAHAAEGFGLDVELHGPGPAHRQLAAALPNCELYEYSLIHPQTGNFHPPVHLGYEDDPWVLGKDGCVEIPDGPGLGIDFDWEFIDSRRLSTQEISATS